FPAFITDWNVYNVALQNLGMVRTLQKGGRPSATDDVEFKTHDGNDIAVDVTVAWRIDTAKTPWILEHAGGSTEEVQEHRARRAQHHDQRGVLRLRQALPEGRGGAGDARQGAGAGGSDRRAGDPRRAPFPPGVRAGDPRQEARGADRGADGERGTCGAAGGAAESRD